ncbi:MAG: hypothetical protein ABIM30_00620 [candidate division WOR-3 bacterium]
MSDIRVLYKVAQGGFWGPAWQSLKTLGQLLWQGGEGIKRRYVIKNIVRNPIAQIGAGGLGLAGGAYMLGRHGGAAAEREKPFFRRMFG